MASPTQRSLALLRKQGYECAITERWNQFARIRQDLFGFIDVLAVADRMIAVQTTSGSNVSARVKKIKQVEAARNWLEAGHRIVVHGWRQVGKAGQRKRWEVREVEISLHDFESEVVA